MFNFLIGKICLHTYSVNGKVLWVRRKDEVLKMGTKYE